MLRACPYCGRSHGRRFDCGKRPMRKRSKQQDAFRSTAQWQHKRDSVRARDGNLCRACLAAGRLTCSGLSVHHIEPLEEAWGLRLDESNLVTLCGYHHELAEAGKLPRAMLHELAAAPLSLSPPPQAGGFSERPYTDWGPSKIKDS